MIPVEYEELSKWEPTAVDVRMMKEIADFLESGCDCALVYMDESVHVQNSIARYYRICKRLKIRGLRFFQKDYKVYVKREEM